jgi:hypothetical protein
MTTDTKYNGWTNYATWRVNLELIDGLDIADMYPQEVSDDDAHTLGELLSEYADNVISEYGERTGPGVDYARAFLADVNWYEIATNTLDAIKAEAA